MSPKQLLIFRSFSQRWWQFFNCGWSLRFPSTPGDWLSVSIHCHLMSDTWTGVSEVTVSYHYLGDRDNHLQPSLAMRGCSHIKTHRKTTASLLRFSTLHKAPRSRLVNQSTNQWTPKTAHSCNDCIFTFLKYISKTSDAPIEILWN